jgi:DNA polymerase (family 10)
VISSDSHGIQQFGNLRYGAGQARRGGLTPADVLNTRGTSDLRGALRRPSSAAAATARTDD